MNAGWGHEEAGSTALLPDATRQGIHHSLSCRFTTPRSRRIAPKSWRSVPSAPIASSQNALNPRSYPLQSLRPESGLYHCHQLEAKGTGNPRRLDEQHESATTWRETWIRRLRRSLGKYFSSCLRTNLLARLTGNCCHSTNSGPVWDSD